jgi:hypothetical protein
MFYRINEDGNAVIFNDDGYATTKIDANEYPIGSDLSCRYEHVNGIVLTIHQSESIGIAEEFSGRNTLCADKINGVKNSEIPTGSCILRNRDFYDCLDDIGDGDVEYGDVSDYWANIIGEEYGIH